MNEFVGTKLPEVRFDTGIAVNQENPTARRLQAMISEKGKIPFSSFMKESLYGKDGYYSSAKARIGKEGGDFQTFSEEKSYAERLAVVVENVWLSMGKPDNFRIAEMGAGEGDLALNLLSVFRKYYPELNKRLQYTIVENGNLVERQRRKLDGFNVQFIKGSASELPLAGIKGVLISNEMPDVFPVEVVRRIEGVIKQKYITIENGKWVECWENPSEEVKGYIDDYKLQIVEREETVALEAARWQKRMDSALEEGAIITVDYGRRGQTAVEEGAVRGADSRDISSFYKTPGNVDITSDVNFAVLEEIAVRDGLRVEKSGTQASLFESMEIRSRIAYKKKKRILRHAQETHSIDELIKLEEKYRLARDILFHDLGYRKPSSAFYAHVLSKNVEMLPIELVREAVKFPKPKLKIGSPNEELTVYYFDESNINKSGIKEPRQVIVRTDHKGRIDMNTCPIPLRLLFMAGRTADVADDYKVEVKDFFDKYKDLIGKCGYSREGLCIKEADSGKTVYVSSDEGDNRRVYKDSGYEK